MYSRLAMVLCLLTIFVVGTLVFFHNQTIDFQTILHAFKVIMPAAAVAYFCGYFIERILKSSTADTVIVNKKAQRKFVDDLLLTPEQVLTLSKLRNYSVEDNSVKTSGEESAKIFTKNR